MQNLALRIHDHHSVLAGQLDPPLGARVLERALGHDPVNVADQRGGKRLVTDLPDALHCQVIVKDHALVPGAGRAASTEHVLSHIVGGASAF